MFPMHQGVKVISEGPRQGETGVTIGRPGLEQDPKGEHVIVRLDEGGEERVFAVTDLAEIR